MTVSVLMRIKEGGKRPYIRAVWNGKKLKPFIGLMNGVEVTRPEASYYLRFVDEGKNTLEPVGKDPAEVLTFLAVRQATLEAKANGVQVVEPVRAKTPGRPSIQEAIDAYLDKLTRKKKYEPTIKSKRYELGEFAKFCKRHYVDEITSEDLIDFREHFLLTKSDRTVYNKLISVVTWLKHNPLLSVRGLLEYPDDYPQKVDTDPEPYTDEDLRKLKQAATPRERLILQFFLSTGCRDQEVAHVEFSDLDREHNLVRIHKKPDWKPKTAAGTRSIPISAALMRDLHEQPGYGSQRLVFPASEGGCNQHFLRLFKDLGVRAGVDKIKLHRFRDSYATHQLRMAKTFDEIYAVAKRMGHSNLDTIKLYAEFLKNTSPEAQEQAAHMDSLGEAHTVTQ
ncbi:MAG TPA: site-specific integrase [Candidatus Acidoferrum sp.]|jgi:integrase